MYSNEWTAPDGKIYRAGDRLTIRTPQGQETSGRVYLIGDRGPVCADPRRTALPFVVDARNYVRGRRRRAVKTGGAA